MPSATKDGYAPYSQQWNLNVQRELPYNMLIQAAWVGNRVIHLPSQNNRIDQMNPSVPLIGVGAERYVSSRPDIPWTVSTLPMRTS